MPRFRLLVPSHGKRDQDLRQFPFEALEKPGHADNNSSHREVTKQLIDRMRQLTTIARALDNESRLRILMSLRSGELCLCQLIELLGLAPSTVSKHVELLRLAGLVERRKDGRWHYYCLAGRGAPPDVREALRWVARALAEDEQILADVARLAGVRAMGPEEWTACYTRN